MSIQLTQHTANVKQQEVELTHLQLETQYLEQRLSLREEQLMLQLQDKDELFSKVQQLEELIERDGCKPSTLQKLIGFFGRKTGQEPAPVRGDFIGKLQVTGNTPEFKLLPKFGEDSPGKRVEETKGQDEEAEDDIAKELERMGLGDLVKKY
jgi:hypothetical protein